MIRLITYFFRRNPIVKKDNLSGGYIAYYKKNNGIVAQGKTQEEALENLKEDIKLVNEFKNSVKTQGDF